MMQAAAVSRGTDAVQAHHIHWPMWADSCLIDPTELEIIAEAMRAHQALLVMSLGAEIHWRQHPSLRHEREYDTQRERVWLEFRAAAIAPCDMRAT